MVLGLMYFALPMAGWLALVWGAKHLVFYLVGRFTYVESGLARLRSRAAARGVIVAVALIVPGSMLWNILTNDAANDLRQLIWLAGIFKTADYFLWEGIGWGFYASLAASVLLDDGKLRRTLVGLNFVTFSFLSLGISFGGPIFFNMVYLLKIIVPIIPLDFLLRFWP